MPPYDALSANRRAGAQLDLRLITQRQLIACDRTLKFCNKVQGFELLLIALGVIGAVNREGLRVPEDISVAGFDGIAIGKLINPTLTSIEMPDLSMGATAASLLLDIVENNAPLRHLELSHALRPGGTVRNLQKEETAAPLMGCDGSGSRPRAA